MDTNSGCGRAVGSQTPSGGHSWFGRCVSAKPRTLDTLFQHRISVKPLTVDIPVSVHFWYNSVQTRQGGKEDHYGQERTERGGARRAPGEPLCRQHHIGPDQLHARIQARRQAPRKVLLTDITYLFFKNGKCYLSTILDGGLTFSQRTP